MIAFVSRLRPRTLNQALGWLLAAVIVPLLLGALALLAVQASQERRLAQGQLTILAQTLVQAVDRELDNGLAQLEVLAASPLVDEQDWSRLRDYAEVVARGKPGSVIGLVGPDGQQLFNTATAWGSAQPNLWKLGEQHREVTWEGRTLPLSSQTLTRQVFATGKVVYSDLYYGLFIKRPTLAISVPVVRNGEVRYALTFSFPPARLEHLIRSAVSASGPRVAVVDRRGLVVASNAAAASRLGDTITPMARPKPGARTYDSTTRDGTAVSGAYAQSERNGFTVRVALPRDDIFSFSRSASAGWLVLVLGALVASVVLAGLLGRRISRPLRELGQAAARGQPPAAVTSGIDEIDVLADALRAAAESERQRREALVLNTQREEAGAALRRADRQKDEFLATLAHELRNPLAPIRSAVELLRRAAPADKTMERARDVIDRQVTHLARMVDDLMDVSRITLGTVHLRQEHLDLAAVASSAADSVRPAAEAAGLTLEQDIAPGPLAVNGDTTRLAQCIVNLLNNAVKFTPRGGNIALKVARRGDVIEVEVTDTGIGIEKASQARIFEPFFQERPSGSQGNSGLGIGLALTRKLVALHGGAIEVASAGPGRGTTFRMELPAAAAEAVVRAPERALAADGEGARVLVVDDNRDAADTLGEMLALSGFEATVEYTGRAAERAVQASRPDAVLLDIGLPDIDGYQVCRRIKTDGNPAPIVIALTGWGQEKDLQRAKLHGFDAHLTKPADPARVIALLKELIGERA
ncbi:MAG: ATP-binding protein [Ramlibacter sp.]|nr:ATP-binding protein [Ramlibacter sp.]